MNPENDTDTYFPKIYDNVQAILDTPENDQEQVLLTAMVTLQHVISNLGQIALIGEYKTLNQKKLELVGKLLAQAIFYVSVISKIRDFDLNGLSMEILTEATENIDPTYHEDRFLCGNNMMLCATDLMEEVYNPVYDGDPEPGSTDGDQTVVDEILAGMGIDLEGSEDDEDQIADLNLTTEGECMLELLACVVIQVALYDLDIDAVFYNATLLTTLD